jgi:hypothetical protein
VIDNDGSYSNVNFAGCHPELSIERALSVAAETGKRYPTIPSHGWERVRVRGIKKADILFLSSKAKDLSKKRDSSACGLRMTAMTLRIDSSLL